MKRRIAAFGALATVVGVGIVVVLFNRPPASPTPVLTLSEGAASDHGTFGVGFSRDFVFAWTGDPGCKAIPVGVSTVDGKQQVVAVPIQNGKPQTFQLPAGYLEVRTGQTVYVGNSTQCHWTLKIIPVVS